MKANRTVALFVDIFDERTFESADLIMDILVQQNQTDQVWTNDVDSSYLCMLSKVT